MHNFGVIFSFVYTVSALLTFHVLVAYGGCIQNFIFCKRFNQQIFIRGGSAPRSNPSLTLLYTNVHEKVPLQYTFY